MKEKLFKPVYWIMLVLLSIDLGPVVPKEDPSILEHITKYLLVSRAFPGPIKLLNHPMSLSKA